MDFSCKTKIQKVIQEDHCRFMSLKSAIHRMGSDSRACGELRSSIKVSQKKAGKKWDLPCSKDVCNLSLSRESRRLKKVIFCVPVHWQTIFWPLISFRLWMKKKAANRHFLLLGTAGPLRPQVASKKIHPFVVWYIFPGTSAAAVICFHFVWVDKDVGRWMQAAALGFATQKP